jgi:hypothetical protein
VVGQNTLLKILKSKFFKYSVEMNDYHNSRKIKLHNLRKIRNKLHFLYRKSTWKERCLPDFIIIGAQKCGTSSLRYYLSQHPQLKTPLFKTEIHYFASFDSADEERYSLGESWYRAHFPLKREITGNTRVFETTPYYLFFPPAPERISSLIPNVKLIAILRNPTDRAISHYFMEWRNDSEPLPMLQAFEQEEARLDYSIKNQEYNNLEFKDHSYKSRGRYAEQLLRYQNYFQKEQILVLSSEEFFNAPYQTLKTVYNFVDVDVDYKISDITPWNLGKKKGEVPPGVREYLNSYYKPYNEALYQMTKRDFGW